MSDFLAAAMSRVTEQGDLSGTGGQKMPRRKLTFLVDHTMCVPGVFEEDFTLTLGSLTPRLELEASKGAKGDPTIMAYAMARLSIMAINGEPLRTAKGEAEFLWEALDAAGRQLVVAMFSKLGTVDDESMGKAEESLQME